MPRRQILSGQERDNLLALPENQQDLIRLFAFSEYDLSIINKRRGAPNRIGFAVQLCYMRYPGIILPEENYPAPALLEIVGKQLNIPANSWDDYSARAETRREHLLILQAIFKFQTFSTFSHYKSAVHNLTQIAQQTDKGIMLVNELLDNLRSQKILLPTINTLERICAHAITLADRYIYQ